MAALHTFGLEPHTFVPELCALPHFIWVGCHTSSRRKIVCTDIQHETLFVVTSRIKGNISIGYLVFGKIKFSKNLKIINYCLFMMHKGLNFKKLRVLLHDVISKQNDIFDNNNSNKIQHNKRCPGTKNIVGILQKSIK